MGIQFHPRIAAMLLVVLQSGWAFAQEELPEAVVLDKPDGSPAVVGGLDKHDESCSCQDYSRFRFWPRSRYPEACEHPLRVPRLGATVNSHLMTQVINGMAAQLVLRDYDFDQQYGGNPVALNTSGTRQLRKISNLLTFLPGPLVIEASARNPELSKRRRKHVIERLQAMGVDFDPENVVVATPAPIGLRGIEAEILYQRLMDQTEQGGADLPSVSSGQGVISPRSNPGSRIGGSGSGNSR